jgi:hypothetical protein
MAGSFEYGAALMRMALRTGSFKRGSRISLFTRAMISLASCIRPDFFNI